MCVLLGAMMRLRALALRHASVAQEYYRAYLAGALRKLLEQASYACTHTYTRMYMRMCVHV
jgi:hypothetical protein